MTENGGEGRGRKEERGGGREMSEYKGGCGAASAATPATASPGIT